jgi:hypothetical protein
MKKKYELVVDYGKPYSEFHDNLKTLKKALIKLKIYYERHSDSIPFMDIEIYEKDKKVTDKIFKMLKFN